MTRLHTAALQVTEHCSSVRQANKDAIIEVDCLHSMYVLRGAHNASDARQSEPARDWRIGLIRLQTDAGA